MPEGNSHHLNPIEWLNKEFFQKILASYFKDPNLEIKDFFTSINSHAADHYASALYRATVEYTTVHNKHGTIFLIVKLISSKVDKENEETSFHTEVNIYKNIMPEIRRLLKLANDSGEIAPRLIFCSTEPQPIMVLEDESHKQFEMYKKPLNFENTIIVATKLARWHAASYFMHRDMKSKFVRDCSKGLFNLKSNDGLLFMQDNMRIFKEEVSKWPGFEVYAEKFENLNRLFMRRGGNVFKTNENENSYCVLNHGDFHYNNMLIQMDDCHEKIKDVVLIDFQLSFWGTPAIDLLYMLYLVPDNETREQHREEIILHYHTEFVKALKNMGFLTRAPSLLDVQMELLRNGFLEVVISICFTPFLFADMTALTQVHSEEIDCNEKDMRRQLYNNPEFKTIIGKLLPQFLYKGLLD